MENYILRTINARSTNADWEVKLEFDTGFGSRIWTSPVVDAKTAGNAVNSLICNPFKGTIDEWNQKFRALGLANLARDKMKESRK